MAAIQYQDENGSFVNELETGLEYQDENGSFVNEQAAAAGGTAVPVFLHHYKQMAGNS